MVYSFNGKGSCWESCGPRMREEPERDCVSTAVQNARDRVTEPVNIAVAYDLHRSLNTQWHSNLLLKD